MNKEGFRNPRRWSVYVILATACIGCALVWYFCTSVQDQAAMDRTSVPRVDLPDAYPPNLGPNVLVLVLDALRADFVGAYSDRWSGQESFTPRIDQVASQGTLFSNAIASGNWTRPSVASLFTGLRPMRHADWFGGGGQNFVGRDRQGRPLAHSLDDSFETLAEVYRKAGYTTACFAPTHRGQFHNLSGFSQGFQFYRAQGRQTGTVRSDQTFDALGDWFEYERPQDRSFFVYLHSLGAHAPYVAPEPYDSLFVGQFDEWDQPITTQGLPPGHLVPGETTRSYYLEAYAGLVRHADHHLGRLLDRLSTLGVLDNTLLVITADHGEELWDHGLPGHGLQLFDETIRVPLLLQGPGVRAAKVDHQVELVDLFPTALDFSGIPRDRRVDGESLLAIARGEGPSSSRSTVISFQNPNHIALRVDNRHKYIYTGPTAEQQAPSHQLFLLDDDPGETRNVAASYPEVVHDLRLELQASVLYQQAGWHLLVDPGAETTQFSSSIRLGSALYGSLDYHCVPTGGPTAPAPVSACDPTGFGASPVKTIDRNRRIRLKSTLTDEALHLHFRPGDPLAPVEFDIRINGQPVSTEQVLLGHGESPADTPLRFEEEAFEAVSVGRWADTVSSSAFDELPRVRIWRVDFPPASPETLPDETVEGLRALGYVD